MAPNKALVNKDIPCCLLLLVTLTMTCHFMVFQGNHATAKSIDGMGRSTKGWSGVGLEISKSLQEELDEVMVNMSNGLLQAINHTMHTSEVLQTVVSLAGMAADSMASHNATKAVKLLQVHMEASGSPLGLLPDLLTSSANKLMDAILKKAIDALDMLLDTIKPVLLDIGKFILKFGDEVQTVIEGFSITLDSVQKLFDQVMASVSSHGAGEDLLRHETFNLFDVSNTGFVTAADLKDVSTLYDVSAFRGSKADDLIKKYGGEDKQMDKEEFKSFVHDPDLPNSMPVLLRTYAKHLAEVAGNTAAARQRDEVALRVVHYLQLVCAKNQTKLGWVAGHLSDGHLPTAFTADIMGELALAKDDPNVLTTADVGGMVITKMMSYHPENTKKAFKLMQDPKFWLKEGFHHSDHPKCVKAVHKWIAHPFDFSPPKPAASNASDDSNASDASNSSNASKGKSLLMIAEVDAMADIMFQKAQVDMNAELESLDALREHAYTQMFSSRSSRMMLGHLLGGEVATSGPTSEAARIVKAGQPAKPITLKFAKELADNATETAKRFQKLCFNYTKKSSNNMDNFATQIQGMVKKVQGFIKMLMKYSTPAGVENLEKQIHSFAEKAGKDVLKLVKKKFGSAVNNSAKTINGALDGALKSVGNNLGHTIASQFATPLGQALEPALESIIHTMLGKNGSQADKTAHALGEKLAELLGTQIGELGGDALGKKLASMLHDMINGAVGGASKLLKSGVKSAGLDLIQEHMALEEIPLASIFEDINGHAQRHLAAHGGEMAVAKDAGVVAKIMAREDGLLEMTTDDLDDTTSGVWNEVATVLRSFSNIMPQATKTLKFARLEVSKLAANLDGLFKPFETTGPTIFGAVAGLWDMIWGAYFGLMLFLHAGLLAYGFWAGGYLGGPGNAEDEEDRTPEEDKGIGWRFQMCCRACCHCVNGCHDMSLSFWSVLIFLQLFVVLIFVVALVFTIMAGVKAFIAAGCSQIYILGDAQICGQTLAGLRSFLETFSAGWLAEHLPNKCMQEELLVCQGIQKELMTSAIFTVVFSFGAALLSLQMTIESAVLHTRAVCRRAAVREANGKDY